MKYNIDFFVATSEQIESALCGRLKRIRLSRNMTQAQLADEAGVSVGTIGRLEKGEGTSVDTLIRVMTALRIQQYLEAMLPDPSVRPAERIGYRARERQRARPKPSTDEPPTWTWGDGRGDDEQ